MQRNPGLDLIRCIAIILVLLAHIAPFFSQYIFINQFLYHSGLYGVELFFVLSGFLIGQSLLTRSLVENLSLTIKHFYLKRVFRIVPLYYLILIILIATENTSLQSHAFYIAHFLFLQNIFPKEVNFFGIAWTMPVEMWFYFLFPPYFMVLSRNHSFTRQVKYIIVTIIILLYIRWMYVLIVDPSFDIGVRKNFILRFDSLLIGVLFSYMKTRFYNIYSFFTKFRFFFIAVISSILFYILYLYYMILYGIVFFDRSYFFRIAIWPIISFMLILIVIYVEDNAFLHRTITKNANIRFLITKCSLYSYAIYLIHYTIYSYFEMHFLTLSLLLRLCVSTILIVLSASILYNFVEKPIMKTLYVSS